MCTFGESASSIYQCICVSHTNIWIDGLLSCVMKYRRENRSKTVRAKFSTHFLVRSTPYSPSRNRLFGKQTTEARFFHRLCRWCGCYCCHCCMEYRKLFHAEAKCKYFAILTLCCQRHLLDWGNTYTHASHTPLVPYSCVSHSVCQKKSTDANLFLFQKWVATQALSARFNPSRSLWQQLLFTVIFPLLFFNKASLLWLILCCCGSCKCLSRCGVRNIISSHGKWKKIYFRK